DVYLRGKYGQKASQPLGTSRNVKITHNLDREPK
ncbi:plasmid replication initiation protein, partial [Lentilactobacillus kefiri]